MKVGFNSDLFMRHPMTGISNYCFEMVAAQQQLDSTVEYLGFTGVSWRKVDAAYLAQVASDHEKTTDSTPRPRLATTTLAGTGNRVLARIAARSGIARSVYRSLRKAQFGRSLARVKQPLDLFHAFNFQPHAEIAVPTLPVIYDLSFVRFPEAHPKERLQFLDSLHNTIARAPLIQTISQFSKREIINVYDYPAQRIFVAPPAASKIFRPLGTDRSAADLTPLGLKVGNYFLTVGTLEPRKNIKTLIAAFTRLSQREQAGAPLVIVGGKGWGQLELPAATHRLIQSGALRFLGSVSDATLRSLYEGARILLFPSIYEGFGMPVVEAMACGTAVAHSSGTSMDEISGGLAIRLAATDVDGWTEIMKKMIAEPVDTQQQRWARTARAAEFDWRRSAALTLGAYRNLADSAAEMN